MKKKSQSLAKGKMVNCLGWCNKMFFSIDPINIRFCNKCKDKRRDMVLSKFETKELKINND
jgi:hypothetical protein